MALLAGIGSWVGPWAMLHVIIVSGFATGFFTVVLLIRNRMQPATGPHQAASHGGTPESSNSSHRVCKMRYALRQPDRRVRVIPFGVMVAIGVIVTKLWIG